MTHRIVDGCSRKRPQRGGLALGPMLFPAPPWAQTVGQDSCVGQDALDHQPHAVKPVIAITRDLRAPQGCRVRSLFACTSHEAHARHRARDGHCCRECYAFAS